MSSKKYTLVAWTDGGELRMVPSLVNIAAEPYRERIEHLEARWEEVEDEIGWLLARSRAHERFARFLLSVVCAWCSDELWLQGESCDFPALPLLYRFLSMHRQCIRLALKDEYLRHRYKGSDLEGHYLFFTLDDRITEQEFSESRESMRAWRFGSDGYCSR